MMQLKLQATEQKATVQNAAQFAIAPGPGATLQQGSISSAPQAAGGSLAAEGQNRRKMPGIRQQFPVPGSGSAGRQQKKSLSFNSLFSLRRSDKTSHRALLHAAAEATCSRGPTLRDVLASKPANAEDDDDSEFQQPPQQRLARERGRSALTTVVTVPAALRITFKPTLATISENAAEETGPEMLPAQAQPGVGNSVAAVARLGISLTDGQLQLAASNPPAINTLLAQTLGKADRHYLAHHVSDDGSQHLLLDWRGHLFDIKSKNNGYSVLHTSQTAQLESMLAKAGDGLFCLKSSNGDIRLGSDADGRNTLALRQPGDVHRSVLSGVWQHPSGEMVCLHDDRIHIVQPETGVWQMAGKEQHSQLSRQADGKLYAIQDKRTLRNLSDNHASERFDDKIKSFAVSKEGQVAILSDGDGPHHLCLMPSLNAPPETHRLFSLHFADAFEMLKHAQSKLEAQSVAIDGGKIYAADSEGKLYSGELMQLRGDALPVKVIPQRELQQQFGDEHRIAGFFTDDYGQLNMLVKDNFRQQHACPLGDNDQFQPGWNLSDALTINNQRGLHQPEAQPLQIVDLGPQGSLTLEEGMLHYFDPLSQGWTAVESDCQQLKKGLDGAAYILKGGEVKPLEISRTTPSISHGKNNIFSLPWLRSKPEPGGALQGLDKADNARAMAVIGANSFLALSESGDIRAFQIKPGSTRLARPVQMLSLEGVSGTLTDIQVDHRQTLYALNQDGEIFHQPRAQWQSGEAGSGWQKLAMPNQSGLQRLDMDNHHQPVATMTDGSQHQLKEGRWHAYSASEPGPLALGTRAAQTAFEKLERGVKGLLIPGTGVTLKQSVQFVGNTGMENRTPGSKFTDRLRAYVFNPTLRTPRPVKNAGYNMQHTWQGRRGLRPLYEMQGALIKQLESHNALNSGAQIDLHSKLDALDLGPNGAELLRDIRRFADELEQSATRAVTVLGQHQRVLKSDGEINSAFKKSSTKAMVQRFNLNRSGRDLTKALEKAVRAAAPSAQSKLHTLLSYFVCAGVNMSHQKGDVPLGRQRDPDDKTSLTKSRLILDVVTLAELHQIADKATLIAKQPPDASQITLLRQQLDVLRDKKYAANPVKQYTDMGFTHNKALEADYDTVKAFINAFKKEHHGVNLSARTLLETHGNDALGKKLQETLLSLDKGESMSFSRAYSGGVSSVFVPAVKMVPVVPGAGVTIDRTYSLSFSRTRGGVNVSFGRDGGVSGTVSVSTGYDLIPHETRVNTSVDNASDWLSKKHKISPDFRIGAGISGSLQGTLQNSLCFKVTEDELPAFIHGLTHGTLTPAQMIQKGVEHQVKQGSRQVFSVDTSAAVDLRAGINITNEGSKPDRVKARGSVGVSASLNLFSGRRERSSKTSQFSRANSASDNRPTALNSASIGANATLSLGVAHGISAGSNVSGQPGQAAGTFPAFISTNVSVALGLDNRTSQSISIEMKHAEPVTRSEVDELTFMLGKHFKDSGSVKILAALKEQEGGEPAKQLCDLQRHFSRCKGVGDDRYDALRNLQKLVLRQLAAESNRMELGSAFHSTSYNNLSRLDKKGIVGLLQQHFHAALPSASATRLSEMMNNDPLLKGFVWQLQTMPFSSASVSMELKDDLRDRTEKAIHEGKIGREELGVLFQDRNNLRIKSISVSQNLSKSEGFNTPALLLGTSNCAGVSMERNIGTINFKYGQDQTIPRRFTLEGEIARADPALATALSELKKEGFELKS